MAIEIEHRGNITILTINRPDRLNAMNSKVRHGLRQAFEDFETSEARVAILTGAGEKAFCAGVDLKEMAQLSIGVPPRDFIPILGDSVHVSKPVIAAVNGIAYAGGWLLAQMCDLCVASTNARFAVTEARVGRGVPWAIPLLDMIPQRLALEILLTATPITAERAYELGFVNHVTPEGGALTRAIELAEAIVECAPLSVKASKALVGIASEHPRSAALDLAYRIFEPVYQSQDALEGPSAFSEKRKPRWSGR